MSSRGLSLVPWTQTRIHLFMFCNSAWSSDAIKSWQCNRFHYRYGVWNNYDPIQDFTASDVTSASWRWHGQYLVEHELGESILKGQASPLLKVKLKLSLCYFLTEHHATKVYWGRWGAIHTFLISALAGDEWSASRPGPFTPRQRALGTRWIGGWMGPRAVLDAVVKRKIPSSCRESNSRTPIIQPVAVERFCCHGSVVRTSLLGMRYNTWRWGRHSDKRECWGRWVTNLKRKAGHLLHDRRRK
jgi:hypothetical protein